MKSKKNLVEKSNKLISMSECALAEKMSLTEFRFFCLYLSKLNARNPNERTVIIPIKDFEQLFDIKVNTTLFTDKICQILKRSMVILDNNSKTKIINLYSNFAWYNDTYTHLEITCNYDIVPYLFELQKNYTSYRIANIVNLNSVSKIRLYEICKQYEKLSGFKIDTHELLKIMQSDIAEFKFFNSKILKPAIKDINEYTDIIISYEKILNCRKVVALKFTITSKDKTIKNIEEIPVQVENSNEKPVEKEKVELGFKFDNSYLPEQLENLFDIAKSVSDKPEAYLKSIYYQIKSRNKPISNLYNYTLSIINADLKNVSKSENQKKESTKPKKEGSILDDYDELWFDKIRTTPFVDTQKFEFDSNMYSTGDIDRLLQRKFNIYIDGIYNYKIPTNPEDLEKLINYIYDNYNVLLIDTNTTEK